MAAEDLAVTGLGEVGLVVMGATAEEGGMEVGEVVGEIRFGEDLYGNRRR